LRECFEGEPIDLWTGDGSDPAWIEIRLEGAGRVGSRQNGNHTAPLAERKESAMPYEDEISLKQLKNLKRKIVSWIWEAPPNRTIQLALFCGIKVPKMLLDQFTSEQ
ncbi:MAG: hypothetical protein V2J65_27650, partial [Desulfobacteraceae bacterium]|nr:hypothetical protein [Desulfobacteraceae bacterium]